SRARVESDVDEVGPRLSVDGGPVEDGVAAVVAVEDVELAVEGDEAGRAAGGEPRGEMAPHQGAAVVHGGEDAVVADVLGGHAEEVAQDGPGRHAGAAVPMGPQPALG